MRSVFEIAASMGNGSVTSEEGAEVDHYSARFQGWVQETVELIHSSIFSIFTRVVEISEVNAEVLCVPAKTDMDALKH